MDIEQNLAGTTPPSHPTREGSPLRLLWGTAVDRGFVAIPSVLLLNFKTLGINPTEFLILLNLLDHWWTADRKPYPRVTTIARRLHVQPRTVQRGLNQLRAKGLVTWDRHQMVQGRIRKGQAGIGVRRRLYDLSNLVDRAVILASKIPASNAKNAQRRPAPEIAT